MWNLIYSSAFQLFYRDAYVSISQQLYRYYSVSDSIKYPIYLYIYPISILFIEKNAF